MREPFSRIMGGGKDSGFFGSMVVNSNEKTNPQVMENKSAKMDDDFFGLLMQPSQPSSTSKPKEVDTLLSAAASDNCFEAFGFPNLSQVSSMQTLKIGLHQLPKPTDEDTKKTDTNQQPGWGDQSSDDDIELTEDADRAAG